MSDPGGAAPDDRRPEVADGSGPDAPEGTGLARLAGDEPLTFRSLVGAVGGVLGIVESVVPTLLFVVLQQIASIRSAPEPLPREALVPVVVIPLAMSLLLVLIRVLRRQGVGTAIGGALVVAVSAVLALVSGDSNNNYALGLVINAAYLLGLLVSLVLGRPLIAVLLASVTQDRGWTVDRSRRRVGARLTLLWSGLFAVRLAVELPLFLLREQLALGIARVVLGVPLYAVVLMATVLTVQALRRRTAV